MTTLDSRKAARRVGLPLIVLLTAGLHGCDGLTQQGIPPFSGPSELSLSLRLTAVPDWVVANSGQALDDDGRDAHGRANVTATLRDEAGGGVPGRTIIFDVLSFDGIPSDQGELRTPGTAADPDGIKQETAVTDGGGNARLVYWSPARTDFAADSSILIAARPEGFDAGAAIYRTVRIEVRSPEPRLFPQDPDNTLPLCNFAVQPFPGPVGGAYEAGSQVLFQSLASDVDGTIVRYEWDFGDGIQDDQPDVNHVWTVPGMYVVTHNVTDDDGNQSFCTFDITIV